ncbi:MFS transporter [Bdellovibrio sp. SKB1291214]|uniref:MFS transporter n=1 Tax=Bdellovibrio sp. SKB1291214 TaxID=1732569 RepID=UPI001130B96F|nr:MFS transporter [Bdellovibrio sp. SKB1291214]UYL07747.1 MFS transporter [Bdellovibrio sp. SKB1291214]
MLLTEFSKSLPSSFLFSMSSYLIGFIVRPVGAYFLGSVADRQSRLRGLRWSVLLIATSSCLVCLIPDSEHWSYYILRVVQGFALGGCYPILSVIIYETAPTQNRGLYTGLFQTSVPAGYLFAIAVTIISRMIIGEVNFLNNGWRVAFIYSAFMFPVWWQLNKLLIKVEADMGTPHKEVPSAWTTAEKKNVIFYLLMATAIGSIAISGVNIKGFFLKSLLKIDPLTANHIIAYSTILYAPTYAMWGALADRVGAYKVSVWGLIAGIFFLLPLFYGFEVFAEGGHINPFSTSWFFIFFFSVGISLIATACFGPFVMLICDHIHPGHRYTIYGVAYNVATGIVGGTAYLVSFSVYDHFNSKYGGIIYIIAIAVISFGCAYTYCLKNKNTLGNFILKKREF